MYLLYNITKAAVLHGTKLEAGEAYLTSRNITVAANCPGWCRVCSLASQLGLCRVLPSRQRMVTPPVKPAMLRVKRNTGNSSHAPSAQISMHVQHIFSPSGSATRRRTWAATWPRGPPRTFARGLFSQFG